MDNPSSLNSYLRTRFSTSGGPKSPLWKRVTIPSVRREHPVPLLDHVRSHSNGQVWIPIHWNGRRIERSRPDPVPTPSSVVLWSVYAAWRAWATGHSNNMPSTVTLRSPVRIINWNIVQPLIQEDQSMLPRLIAILLVTLAALTISCGDGPPDSENGETASKDRDIPWDKPMESLDRSPVLVRSIDAADTHACAIKLNGNVACWGSNEHGESSPPEQVFREISAGQRFTCGITDSQQISCWGINNAGQSQPPEGNFKQISAGRLNACAIDQADMAVCWGSAEESAMTPPAIRFKQISVGNWYACGIRPDSTVTCWTNNERTAPRAPDGQFERISTGYTASCGIRPNATLVCWDATGTVPNSELPTGRFDSVSGGHFLACGARSTGDALCWGDMASYVGDAPDKVRSITVGNGFACGIREDDRATCWGLSQNGVASLPNGSFKTIAASISHTCATNQDDEITCWGHIGKRGLTPPRTHFRSISAGYNGTCGITADLDLICWASQQTEWDHVIRGPFRDVSVGYGNVCAIEQGGRISCAGADTDLKAGPPTGAFDFVSVATWHACALDRQGAATCWGKNEHGESTPPSGPFQQIMAGSAHSCGLKPDQTIQCWGSDENGNTDPPDDKFALISQHAVCGITIEGSIKCWGKRSDDQTPAGPFIVHVSGARHDCALRPSGTIICWGDDAAGQPFPPGSTLREAGPVEEPVAAQPTSEPSLAGGADGGTSQGASGVGRAAIEEWVIYNVRSDLTISVPAGWQSVRRYYHGFCEEFAEPSGNGQINFCAGPVVGYEGVSEDEIRELARENLEVMNDTVQDKDHAFYEFVSHRNYDIGGLHFEALKWRFQESTEDCIREKMRFIRLHQLMRQNQTVEKPYGVFITVAFCEPLSEGDRELRVEIVRRYNASPY